LRHFRHKLTLKIIQNDHIGGTEMRKLLLLAIVFTMLCFGCTQTDTYTNTNTNTNATAAASPAATPVRAAAPRPDDNQFAMTVAQNGMAEIALAKMALQQAQNADVKKFAQRVITDHTKVGNELKSIAAAKKITLPSEAKPEQKETHDRFMKLKGAEFDREFMNLMTENHDKSVTSFQGEANDGSDAEIKAFANKTLPTLREHLQMARDITSKLTS